MLTYDTYTWVIFNIMIIIAFGNREMISLKKIYSIHKTVILIYLHDLYVVLIL